MGREDSYAGTIYDEPEVLTQRTAQLVNLDPWRRNAECGNYRFLPLCLGGCGQQALLKYGTRDHINCQKAFIEEYLPEALKLAYERNRRFPEISLGSKEEIKNMLKF